MKRLSSQVDGRSLFQDSKWRRRDGVGRSRLYGLIVEAEPRAITEALDALYNDRERARGLGENGHKKVLALNLSWPKIVEKIISAAS